jgi:hypothetical protein
VAEIAGYMLIAIGAAHVLLAFVWIDRSTFRRLAPTPWAKPDDELRTQRDFWSQIGSFGVPVVLLGAVIGWAARRGDAPPVWVGVVLLVWAVTAIARVPRGGFWVLLVPAVLLIIEAT